MTVTQSSRASRAGTARVVDKRRVGRAAWFVSLMAVIVMLGAASAQAASSAANGAPLEPPTVAPTPTPVPANLHALVPVDQYTISRTQAEASQPAETIEYYEKHFGVSSEVARSRLATQAMGAGLEAGLRKQIGNAATEVWFDNSTGEWVADISTAASATVSSVAANEGISGSYRVQHVGYTRIQLLKGEEAVISRLSSTINEGLVQVGIAEGKIDVSLASGLDEQAARGQEAAEAAATVDGSPPVVVTHSSESTFNARTTARCLFPFCDTLMGGDMYGTYGPKGENFNCTMSWWAGYEGINAVEHPLMLTAGHCSRDGGYQGIDVSCLPYPGGCAGIGINAAYYFGNDGDWSAIAVSYPPPSGWDPGLGRPYGGYVNWNSDGISKLEAYYASGPAPVGMVVCHQGYGSGVDLGDGSQCGRISENNVVVKYPEGTVEKLSKVSETEVCPGDSGGPWDGAASAVAVGITSGGVFKEGQTCGTTAYFTPVWVPVVGWKLVLYGG